MEMFKSGEEHHNVIIPAGRQPVEIIEKTGLAERLTSVWEEVEMRVMLTTDW